MEGRERELPGSHHGTLRSHHGTLDRHHHNRGERECREGRGEGRLELVQVAEKKLSRIENVHAHISPTKVGHSYVLYMCAMPTQRNIQYILACT